MRPYAIIILQWVTALTSDLVKRAHSGGAWVSMTRVRRTARAQREYFKALTFHPMLITLSWAKNSAPRALVEAAQLQVQQKAHERSYVC